MWFFNPVWIVEVVLYGFAVAGLTPFSFAPIGAPVAQPCIQCMAQHR